MLDPLYYAISWVLLKWYWVFTTLGLSETSGLTWALSIVMLVVTARLALFRMFIKQVKYTRKMQELQPRLQAIREKYKNDKAEQQRQMMAFQQAEGFNPLSGCLPMLVQMPIFIALFHVLRRLHPGSQALYGWTQAQTNSYVESKLFGVPMVASFTKSAAYIEQLGGSVLNTKVLLIALTAVSAFATHMTQRLAMQRATTVPTGQAATVQKLMLYIIPVFTFGSGFVFPLGVLLYWFTSNNWTMMQQVYINRVHPAEVKPGEIVASKERAKSLAPKPGARPSRGPRDTVIDGDSSIGESPAVELSKSADAPGSSGSSGSGSGGSGGGSGGSGGSSSAGARSTVPRPGTRPAKTGSRPGSRPQGASKAKKRR